jgi:hypothetical protein
MPRVRHSTLRSIARPLRTLTRCLVCGFAEVRTDEVVQNGLVLLGECPRCEHRFTQPLPGVRELSRVRPERIAAPRRGEIVAA